MQDWLMTCYSYELSKTRKAIILNTCCYMCCSSELDWWSRWWAACDRCDKCLTHYAHEHLHFAVGCQLVQVSQILVIICYLSHFPYVYQHKHKSCILKCIPEVSRKLHTGVHYCRVITSGTILKPLTGLWLVFSLLLLILET